MSIEVLTPTKGGAIVSQKVCMFGNSWQVAAGRAAKILSDELERAKDRELELRWEPIRAAIAILENGSVDGSVF